MARHFKPLLVNTVVGFIGPEYLYDGKQIIRAGLEDHFCGKLLGLPMGVDVCYTNHADADQDDMDYLLTLLAVAGCTYIMGVPGADDVMLSYQSTSFHDALYVRSLLNLRPAPEFEAWLHRYGHRGRAGPYPGRSSAVQANYSNSRNCHERAGRLARSHPLHAGASGAGRAGNALPTQRVLEFQLAHARARDAVNAPFDVAALAAALEPRETILLETNAGDRHAYLTHPDRGRRLSPASRAGSRGANTTRRSSSPTGSPPPAIARHGAALAHAIFDATPGFRWAPTAIVTNGTCRGG